MREHGASFVMENTILRQGKQCFQRSHYLCKTKDGNCLPCDSRPFEAIATNLYITKVEKKGDWARVTGKYDVMVWFRYGGGQLIAQSEDKDINFSLQLPLKTVGKPILSGLKTRLCVQNIDLRVVKAVVEKDGKDICPGCSRRLKVVVEQEIIAFESALSPLTLPSSWLLKEIVGSSKKLDKFHEKPPTAPALIKGKVINKKGHSLARVKVKACNGNEEYSARTNSDGYYFLALYPDDYELRITSNGYIAQTLQLKLSSGQIKLMDIQLEKDPKTRL